MEVYERYVRRSSLRRIRRRRTAQQYERYVTDGGDDENTFYYNATQYIIYNIKMSYYSDFLLKINFETIQIK
jgi:hypothetical protein